MPTNKLKQHTFNVRETAKMFNDKLTLNASVMGSVQDIENRPISGLYFNPLVGVYGFEAENERLSDYQDFQAIDPDRNIQSQRWWRGTSDIEQNPYWILNRNKSYDTSGKLLASLKLDYEVNNWLSLQTRGTYDRSQLDYERKIYATTEATLAPLNGRYILNQNDYTQYYIDLIATINTNISENITINSIIGTSATRSTAESLIADSGTNGGLQFANVFSIQNFNASPQASFAQQSFESRTNSVFMSTTLGFSDKVYVDLTARNDWVSTIPKPNNSFLYGSIGATGILTNLFDLGEKVSFAKVRASYGEVGNGFGPDQINPNRAIIFGQGVSPFTPIRPYPGTTPKPERQRSFEVGTEWKFNNNRYGFDIGYYRTSTINQYFDVPIAPSNPVGLDAAGINSGDILNSGVELTAFAIPVQNDNFEWRTTVNFATNKNEVETLLNSSIDGLDNLDFVALSPKGVNTFASYLTEGGAYGDIYAQVVRRNENGLPIVDVDNENALVIDDDNLVDGLTKVGNANPDWTLGWSNSFTYKNFSLNLLVDGKFGGETVSMTQAVVEGLSNNSARETANGTIDVVDLAGNPATISAQDYYGRAGGRNGFTGEYVYSATN
jgi:outer membrane receptor protein involved in Fe transport